MASTTQQKKQFVPLENNPEVMNTLIRKLGLKPTFEFHEVFDISSAEFLSFIPRPASALMLIFPITARYKKIRKAEDSKREVYTGKGEDEPVMWYRQTVGNACGLMALLHIISNGAQRQQIEQNSLMDKFIKQATPLDPTARAELIYNSSELENLHSSAAQQGSTSAPDASEEVDLHFVAFVKDQQGRLWELDGSRVGPIELGKLSADEDLLSDRALDLTVRAFVKREQEGGNSEERFSLLALAPA